MWKVIQLEPILIATLYSDRSLYFLYFNVTFLSFDFFPAVQTINETVAIDSNKIYDDEGKYYWACQGQLSSEIVRKELWKETPPHFRDFFPFCHLIVPNEGLVPEASLDTCRTYPKVVQDLIWESK